MKLDDELRERLQSVAEHVPVGEPVVRGFVRRGRRRSRVKVVGVVSSVVVLLAGAGILGRAVQMSGSGGEGLAFQGAPQQSRAREPFAQEAVPPPAPVDGALTEDNSASGGAGADEDAVRVIQGFDPGEPSGGASVGPDEVVGIGPRVIKTSGIELEVPEGEFQERFSDAERIAARYGGHVTDSETSGEEARSGAMTIRVPVASFEAARADLKRLGTVRSDAASGVDVTSEFVDLNGRLRIHNAEARFLFRKLRQASTISQSIQIHRRLQDVQFDIERLRGQLRLLRDQTDFGTIDVSMYEVGEAPEGEEEGASPLAGAWSRAIHGTETVVAAIVVGLGYLLPIILLLALLWLGGRAIRARTA